jgi:hypothetical protein
MIAVLDSCIMPSRVNGIVCVFVVVVILCVFVWVYESCVSLFFFFFLLHGFLHFSVNVRLCKGAVISCVRTLFYVYTRMESLSLNFSAKVDSRLPVEFQFVRM